MIIIKYVCNVFTSPQSYKLVLLMVLILDGNSNMLRTHEGKLIFSEKKIQCVTVLIRIECLKYITQQRLLLTFAHISELLTHISTLAENKLSI